MKIKIAKDFYWEMSHRLPDHPGLCRNIHGHSYKMQIELEGEPTAQGMVLDYYELSKIVKPFLEQFDHAFLCDENDSLMIEFLRTNNFKHSGKHLPVFCYRTSARISEIQEFDQTENPHL